MSLEQLLSKRNATNVSFAVAITGIQFNPNYTNSGWDCNCDCKCSGPGTSFCACECACVCSR